MARANERLRRARKLRGWSQDYVAAKIGVPHTSYVSRWERGEFNPHPLYRQRLCKLYGMNAEELGFLDEGPLNVLPDEESCSEGVDSAYKGTQGEKTEGEQKTSHTVTAPLPRKIRKPVPFYIVVLLITLAIVLGTIVFVIHPYQLGLIKPGGGWISPQGQMVGPVIHFAAYAYPTNPGDPQIDHVNFTAYWQGVDPRKWVILCVARKPISGDVFACDADISALGAPPGNIIVSFDVYDRQGNHSNAPSGEHTVIYSH